MVNKTMISTEYISSTQLAKLLGISHVAVYKKIIKGEIPAKKIGRNYAIPVAAIGGITSTEVSQPAKDQIKAAVSKTVKEYGEALRLLGQE